MTTPEPALQGLRHRFPHWAILYNPFTYRWHALHGRTTTLTADTPQELAERIVRHQVHQRLTRPQPRR
ncbi:hypothetical protein [Sphaerisporangium corydalis]|uniref:Uncharacterized protein n=1 Tax=Sphaerisporangium corydalis TaxID=1441875 RepID=A0ABV9ETW6_9ACTN|nr:hypothetical protein [Sphaerisporangium corydalis]